MASIEDAGAASSQATQADMNMTMDPSSDEEEPTTNKAAGGKKAAGKFPASGAKRTSAREE